MKHLIEMMQQSKKYCEAIGKITENEANSIKKPMLFLGMSEIGKLQVMSAILQEKQKNIFYITTNKLQANKLAKDLKYFTNNVEIFNPKEIHFFTTIGESKENLFERMKVLKKINSDEKNIIIVPVEALMQKMVKREVIEKEKIEVKINTEINLTELIVKLEKYGYNRVSTAETKNTYSIRGGILDIVTSENIGFRIEFFGDFVETIRDYDLVTQKSLTNITELLIYPATEYIINKSLSEINELISNKKVSEAQKSELFSDLDKIREFGIFEYIEKYFDTINQSEITTFLDYITSDDLVVIDENSKIMQNYISTIKGYNNLNKNLIEKNKLVIEALEIEEPYDQLIKNLANKSQIIYLSLSNATFDDSISMKAQFNKIVFSYKESTFFRSEVDDLLKRLKKLNKTERIILLTGNSKEEITKLLKIKDVENELKFIDLEAVKDNCSLECGIYISNGELSSRIYK